LELIEAYGTGVPKILQSYEGCPVQPKFESSDNAFKITLPNQNSIPSRTELSEAEMTIVKLVENKGKIARKDVEAELGASQTLSGRILKNMVSKGILQSIGKGKNIKYFLKKP
jgi:ATP-dependent DNA helicase RecG